jgi:hypothetical protein
MNLKKGQKDLYFHKVDVISARLFWQGGQRGGNII